MTAALALARLAPDLAAIERVLVAIEDGAHASRELDADVFTALGWRVTRHAADDRHAWTALSPLSRTPLPLPRATKRLDCARTVLPHGWDWSAGERQGAGQAWCHNRRREGDPLLASFEGCAATPALALVKVALFAQRAVAMAALMPPEPQLSCRCS